MHKFQTARGAFVMASSCAVGVAMALPAFGHEMLEVGVNSAKTQLMPHFDITFPIEIPVSVIPGVSDFADIALGFEALLFDEAPEDVFKLPDDCDIYVRVMSSSPGVFLWNDNTTAQLNVGEAFHVGLPYFHTHPIWQITEPGYGENFLVVLRLEDASGHYQSSEQFTVTFTPVPAPGAIGLLGAAGMLAARRRR